ncbi:hypothetical protein [Longimicrobium sp.]|uniref:hypothetical protein n=1 Tax=Longimicrobium sp. TaxID=2029185 RepID=UPI002BC6F4E4|nr:hypothetical protein [Longimicrobium sp.]HSU15171.1 hypothetical protein [Longimicrobium sp.]
MHMLTAKRVISDRHPAAAARYLARLAARGGGYTVRGVSGWAHRHEVEEGTRARHDGQLPRLHAMGLLDRVDAGPSGGTGGCWVYRITDAGARASAETWGDAYERVRVPGEMEKPAPVYLAPGPRNALAVLRLAYDAQAGPRRFGEDGWRTGREPTLIVEESNRQRAARRYSRLDSMDLKWLARGGFAEKRDERLWGRDQPVVYWRVSEAGRSVVLLPWRAPCRDDTEDGDELA